MYHPTNGLPSEASNDVDFSWTGPRHMLCQQTVCKWQLVTEQKAYTINLLGLTLNFGHTRVLGELFSVRSSRYLLFQRCQCRTSDALASINEVGTLYIVGIHLASHQSSKSRTESWFLICPIQDVGKETKVYTASIYPGTHSMFVRFDMYTRPWECSKTRSITRIYCLYARLHVNSQRIFCQYFSSVTLFDPLTA